MDREEKKKKTKTRPAVLASHGNGEAKAERRKLMGKANRAYGGATVRDNVLERIRRSKAFTEQYSTLPARKTIRQDGTPCRNHINIKPCDRGQV